MGQGMPSLCCRRQIADLICLDSTYGSGYPGVSGHGVDNRPFPFYFWCVYSIFTRLTRFIDGCFQARYLGTAEWKE